MNSTPRMDTLREKSPRNSRLVWLADALFMAIFAAVLIWPLFTAGYLDRWSSIESTFIADGRFLKEHWPKPQWQPLWYCGTRFDYIYPPALRYGTAGIAKALSVLPVHAYHLYIAVFYCIGIAGVYLLIRAGTNRRLLALLGASAVALISPVYLFVPALRVDGLHSAPWRLHVLMKYGEGPHVSALSLIPFALACTLIAFRGGRPLFIGMAAVFCALVVSNNFYGAFSLAVFFSVLTWAYWITSRDKRVLGRAVAIAALAYGLTAFWLVPSYFSTTFSNLKFVAEPGNAWSMSVFLAIALVYVVISWKLVRGRPELAFVTFEAGALLFFAVLLLGHHANLRVIGVAARLGPEFDLAFILCALEVLHWLWRNRSRHAAPGARLILVRASVVIVLLAAFGSSRHYLRSPWKLYTADSRPQERIEYRIPHWIKTNLPGARVVVGGSVRFWYDTWSDLPQLGGGSDQGVLNIMALAAQYAVTHGDVQIAKLWSQCMGVDAIVVHDKHSTEHYHDYGAPEQFAGAFPLLFASGEGDFIYRVPRRQPNLVSVVQTKKLAALPRFERYPDRNYLAQYASMLEELPPGPSTLKWEGADSARVRVRLAPGQAAIVHVSHDPYWRAYSHTGSELRLERDPLGQMILQAAPGEHEFRLVFETPLENRVGTGITLVSITLVAFTVFRRRITRGRLKKRPML